MKNKRPFTIRHFSTEVLFRNQKIQISLDDTFFYDFESHQIKFKRLKYRDIRKSTISEEEYQSLIENINKAIIKSEELAHQFFLNGEDKEIYLEMMADLEFSYVDLIAYNLPFNNISSPFYRFDIGIEWLDKNGEVFFMYDGRSSCNITYTIDYSNNLTMVVDTE